MTWYDVTYQNRVYWADPNGHNGYSEASATVTLRILAENFEDAIARSKKAIPGLTRKSNNTYPHLTSWTLIGVEPQER